MSVINALVVGAGGFIGDLLLTELLKDDQYRTVEIWVRKTLGNTHPKLLEKIINFDTIKQMDTIEAEHVFCCLGTTIAKARTKEAFRKVDYQYVVDLAKLAENSGVKKFLVVSSISAKATSGNFYLQTKGEMEEEVSKYTIPSIYLLKPSMLLGERKEQRFGESIGKIIFKIFGFLMIGGLKKYRGIEGLTVARAMIKLAKRDDMGVHIIESDGIEEIV